MTLHVFTARIFTRDPDLLDVTRKSAGPEGIAFAPSWAILRPALDARSRAVIDTRRAQAATGEAKLALLAGAERIEADSWATYVEAYTAEMRASYRAQRAAWAALLRRERVVLACYCQDAARCHRRLLAGILAKLGAVDEGEIVPPARTPCRPV